MRRSVELLAVAALVVVAAGCGGGGKPRFEPAADWHLLGAHGELVAANVGFASADRDLASPPFHTVAALPRSGTVMWLLVMPRRHSAIDAKFPARPLRVGNALPSNTPEGFPCAPAVHCLAAGGAIRRMQARLSDWDVALTIFFGTDHPSAGQVRAANAELARLRP
jgi:hypothetical protein